MTCNHRDFVTTFEQFWFQKSCAQFNDFAQEVNFFMTFCNIWVISTTLSSIAVLLFKEQSMKRCILKWAFSASVFIFFHNQRVVSCMKDVRRHNFVTIERWSDFWCRSVLILHLYIMNWIFSLSNTRSIVVSWLWVSLVIVPDSSSSFSLAFVTMSSRVSVAVWWVKHLLSSQCEWCRLKFSTISCLQSSLISSFRREIVDDYSVKMIDSEHEL